MPYEGQLFEFLLSYPINVFDDRVWPALHVKRADLEILLLKPITQPVSTKEQSSSGNEVPDLFVTSFPAIVERTSRFYPLTHQTAFSVVQHATRWIRILTRQYWVGSGTAGISARYRGSSFRVEGDNVFQRNFAHYGQSVLVRSLSKEIWASVIYPVENKTPVPIPHSMLCDALTSFAVGDTVLALVQLGVACEIAVTNLLDDVAATIPSTPGAKAYLRARHNHKDRFGAKINTHAPSLGLQDPNKFHPDGKPANWVELALLLYSFRNKAAHEGRPLIKDRATGVLRTLNAGELQSFIFASETLLLWVFEQRKLTLGTPDVPISPSGQIVSILGNIDEEGGFGLETGESRSTASES